MASTLITMKWKVLGHLAFVGFLMWLNWKMNFGPLAAAAAVAGPVLATLYQIVPKTHRLWMWAWVASVSVLAFIVSSATYSR